VNVYVVNKYVGNWPSDGECECLKVYASYADAQHFVRSYREWVPEFCDLANDTWGTEYYEICIEEKLVE